MDVKDSLLRQGCLYAVVFNNCNAEINMNESFDDKRKDPLHEWNSHPVRTYAAITLAV